MIKGKWKARRDKDILMTYIENSDFSHDVRLYVLGDFEDVEQELEYAKEIAGKLNQKDKK